MLLSSQRNNLEKGDILELEFYDSQNQISSQKLVIESLIGEGASCVSYLVRAYIDQENSRRMVLKEFYPDPYRTDARIVRNPEDKSLSVLFSEGCGDDAEFKRKKKEFENAFVLQNQLSDAESGEAMVKPYRLARLGDSSYLISDIFSGRVMYEYEMAGLEEKLIYMGRLAEAVALIHEQGYLCVDLHPKNVLCIDAPKVVKLFDVDSLIKMDGIDLPDGLKMTVPYGAPEINQIKARGMTADWIRKYLNPGLDIYPLGVMLFEILFGRLPEKEDRQSLQRSDCLVRELCRKEGLEKDSIIERLHGLLFHSMNEIYYARFGSAKEMYDEINLMLKEIGAQPFIPKRKVAEANYSYTSFHVLEKYPLFDYARTENGRRKLDVSIVGSHRIRPYMLKTLLSCGQMLDSDLNIRIFAEDAGEFWEEFTSERNNPDLPKAVTCHWNGEEAEDCCDLSLVDQKLADIWLYPLSGVSGYRRNSLSVSSAEEKIVDTIRESGSNYLLLFGNEEENRKLAKRLTRIHAGNSRCFIGYLTGKDSYDSEKSAISYGSSGADYYEICMRRVTEEYNEGMFRSRIYKMGLQVHGYYYRGNERNASWKKIEEDYRSNLYNMTSSQRCALHAIYKMASIGIDWRSDSAAEEFYRKVLGSKEGKAKENFDNLTYLEHRSWTAFMLTHGHVQASMEDFRKYAYVGGNDWKDRRDKAHIKHPCLAAGRPGRGLTDEIMEHSDSRSIQNLDHLDRVSLLVHDESKKIAEERKENIRQIFQDIKRLVNKQTYPDADDALQWLKACARRCYSAENHAEIIWKKALKDFQVLCQKNGLFELKLDELIKRLADEMMPALQVVKRHDFKQSDEDIIRALPSLLEIGKAQGIENDRGKRILVKPLSKYPWKNIYSSLLLEPQKLILVSDGEKADVDFYRDFFQSRGLDEIFISTRLSHLAGEKIYVDFTGAEAEIVQRIRNHPDLQDALGFTIEDRKIMPVEGGFLQIYQKEILLSVEEILYLAKAIRLSGRRKPITRPEWTQCRNIWQSCVEKGYQKWKTLIKMLGEVEKQKQWRIEFREEDADFHSYSTEHIPAALLTISGLRDVLLFCRKQKLIKNLTMPIEQQDRSIQFQTGYTDLGVLLIKFIQDALKRPFEHHYLISQYWEDGIGFQDDSLYVKIDRDAAICREDAAREELEAIDLKGKNMVFQNLKVDADKEKMQISFSYASDAVRDVFRNEKSILNAVIYEECLRNRMFDDIRMGSEFQWREEFSGCEVDLIGVKSSKIFLIYTSMTIPGTEQLEKMSSLAEKFAGDGQAVLVCGEFAGDEKEEQRLGELKEECSRRKIYYTDGRSREIIWKE